MYEEVEATNGILSVLPVGLVIVIIFAILTSLLFKILGGSSNHEEEEEEGKETTGIEGRDYTKYKVEGMTRKKRVVKGGKDMCPCGSGLKYTDCCGK